MHFLLCYFILLYCCAGSISVSESMYRPEYCLVTASNKTFYLSSFSNLEINDTYWLDNQDDSSPCYHSPHEAGFRNYVLKMNLCRHEVSITFPNSPPCLSKFNAGTKIISNETPYAANNGLDIILVGSLLTGTNQEGQSVKYVFRVECSQNSETKVVMNTVENEKISITLKSEAGCPVVRARAVENSCLLESKEHKVTYDFGPLVNSKGFVINSELGIFTIGICSNVRSQCHQDSAICWSKNTSLSFPAASAELQYNPHIGIQLFYWQKSGENYAVVNFKCWNKATSTAKFVSNKNNLFQFDIYTSLACLPKEAECSISGYDLSSLSAPTNNPEVTFGDKKIIFNLCQPLNYFEQHQFSGGSIFAALVEKNGTAFSLGNEQFISKNKTGQLLVSHKGNEREFMLKLVLECSESSESKSTSLNGSTFVIVWKTPAACPVLFESGGNCSLYAREIGVSFNFTRLQSSENNVIYTNSSSSSYFKLQLCEPLNKSEGSGVIWYDQGKEVILGGVLDSPQLWGTNFRFTSTGDRCGPRKDHSRVILEMVCSENKNKLSFIKKDGCQFTFRWETDVVCFPTYTSPCFVNDRENTSFYDLTSLSTFENNYLVKLKDSVIYFHVCRNIRMIGGVLCEKSSGACLMKSAPKFHPIRFTSIGNIPELGERALHFISEGHLVLNYSRIEQRMQINQQTSFEFTINFYCNSTTGEPRFVSSDGNKYVVEWFTDKACPVGHGLIGSTSSTTASTTDIEPTVSPLECISRSLPIVDLHSLAGQVWNVPEKDTNVSICRPLPRHICPSESGICTKRGSAFVNIGKSNNVLLKKGHLVYLNYSGPGSFQTLITFGCFLDEQPPRNMYFMDDTSAFVYWPSDRACILQELQYELCSNRQLNPLCDLTETYRITLDDKRDIYVSLLGQLNDPVRSFCPTGTGVCLVERGLNSLLPLYRSLGYPTKDSVDNFGHHSILYNNGDFCDREGSQFYSTLRFTCDPNAGKGRPIFMGNESCHYFFEWNTSLICPQSVPETSFLPEVQVPCSPMTQFECLKEFLGEPQEIFDKSSKSAYLINWSRDRRKSAHCAADICSKSPAGIWEPFVNYQSTKYLNVNKTRLFEFNNLGESFHKSKGSCSASFFLKCISNAIDKISLKWNVNCSIGVEWETKRLCFLDPEEPSSYEPDVGSIFPWILTTLLCSILIIPCGLYFLRCRKAPFRGGCVQKTWCFKWNWCLHFHYQRTQPLSGSQDSLTNLFPRSGTISSDV